MSTRSIGIIGLGLLGGAAARRLRDKSLELVGYDIQEEARRKFQVSGGRAVLSATQIAQQCNQILFCLPDSAVVQAVVGELNPHLTREHSVLDLTTGHPQDALSQAAKLTSIGATYFDCPVVGSSSMLEAGEAVLLVGARQEELHEWSPILASLAKRVFYLEERGQGSCAKLAVNMAIGLHRAVLAESLSFGIAQGIDGERLLEIFQSTLAYSAVMDTKGKRMLTSSFEPVARLKQHLKDVELMLDLAQQAQASTPLSNVHQKLLQELVEAGCGDLDNSAIAKAFMS